MLFITTRGRSCAEVRAEAIEAARLGCGVEVRLDFWEELDLGEVEGLVGELSIPCMLTLRGRQTGEVLRELLGMGPDYLDVEEHHPRELLDELAKRCGKTRLILSYHGEVWKEFSHPGYCASKVAVAVRSHMEALELLVRAKRSQGRLVVIGTGPWGDVTRILAPLVGAPFMFASLGGEGILGQLPAEVLCGTYRWRELSTTTRIYALLGNPVGRSVSHVTHNALFGRLGVDAVYVKIALEERELPRFFEMARELPFDGFSVTMPFKESFGETPINTLVRAEGGWGGLQTDGPAVVDLIEERLALPGKKVLIVGAGGTASAVAHEAKGRGAEVFIVNRTHARVEALAQRLGVVALRLEEVGGLPYDVLVQATSCGMAFQPESLPLPLELLRPEALVVELVSNPPHTPFLRYAIRLGCPHLFGYQIFARQAALQFSRWLAPSLPLLDIASFLEERSNYELITKF